jgi:hypothetical protein
VPETIRAGAAPPGQAQPGQAQSGQAPSSQAPSGQAPSGQAPGTDGTMHRVQLGLTAFTLVAGIIAFVAGLIVRQHLAATVLGLAAMVIGLYTQMISATRLERIFLMAGVVPAFVGLCLGLAHGGFS